MTPSPSPAPAPARNAYIDALRGFSIFGVVCVHFAGSFANSGNAWTPSFFLGLGLNQFFSFAVPLFVFLSGLLAGLGSRKGPVRLREYYLGRLWRIGVPYLFASAAAFVWLNHLPEWQILPDGAARLAWLARKLGFEGVEPTLYFIPLILYLYLLQPLLKALPGWVARLTGGSPERMALVIALLLLALHVTLGVLCFRNVLSYYVWARPNPLFWVFYFFLGLHFRALASFLSPRALRRAALAAAAVALGAMLWNGWHLLDRTVVGANFEFSALDYAYSRPVMLVFDLAMVVLLGTGVALDWPWRAGLVSFLGRFTLEIYLWHILVLYYGAWRYEETLAACRAQPELIVIICAATCLGIAGIFHGVPWLAERIRQYRLALIKVS
jgi:surface polysaccharide O-acyltransferase-like enzyme